MPTRGRDPLAAAEHERRDRAEAGHEQERQQAHRRVPLRRRRADARRARGDAGTAPRARTRNRRCRRLVRCRPASRACRPARPERAAGEQLLELVGSAARAPRGRAARHRRRRSEPSPTRTTSRPVNVGGHGQGRDSEPGGTRQRRAQRRCAKTRGRRSRRRTPRPRRASRPASRCATRRSRRLGHRPVAGRARRSTAGRRRGSPRRAAPPGRGAPASGSASTGEPMSTTARPRTAVRASREETATTVPATTARAIAGQDRVHRRVPDRVMASRVPGSGRSACGGCRRCRAASSAARRARRPGPTATGPNVRESAEFERWSPIRNSSPSGMVQLDCSSGGVVGCGGPPTSSA